MKIKDDKSDALELIKDIKREMEVLKGYLATLEYLVYQCDERVEIRFFERGVNDKGRSKKGIATDKRDQ